ncbi:uncharacterized protein FYW47_018888 [Aplochiton taeniatus]
MERKERSHFFSVAEQELILGGYEEEKQVLLRKSNTARSAKLRVEAWQRIAEKLNTASGSSYERTWLQVKTKHKNILQTANKKKTEVRNTEETAVMVVTEDIKALYRRYLKKEMENRDHEMAYRALKMRKLEKEIQLLDRQLVCVTIYCTGYYDVTRPVRCHPQAIKALESSFK